MPVLIRKLGSRVGPELSVIDIDSVSPEKLQLIQDAQRLPFFLKPFIPEHLKGYRYSPNSEFEARTYRKLGMPGTAAEDNMKAAVENARYKAYLAAQTKEDARRQQIEDGFS
jgi:hypothetical protein